MDFKLAGYGLEDAPGLRGRKRAQYAHGLPASAEKADGCGDVTCVTVPSGDQRFQRSGRKRTQNCPPPPERRRVAVPKVASEAGKHFSMVDEEDSVGVSAHWALCGMRRFTVVFPQ